MERVFDFFLICQSVQEVEWCSTFRGPKGDIIHCFFSNSKLSISITYGKSIANKIKFLNEFALA